MAVYTHVSPEEIQALADHLRIGTVTSIQAVAAGVENTTYFLFAQQASSGSMASREYVLTIAETIGRHDLTFIAELCELLSHHGLPVPAPVCAASGAVVMVANKPAIVVPKMPGAHPTHPAVAQCSSIGDALGRIHLVTQTRRLHHHSHRSLDWVAATGVSLLSHLAPTDQALLNQELAFLDDFIATNMDLPQAIIHGDLFCDNALFLGDKLTAVIDFFSAGTGFLLLDLAIAANDWCRQGDVFLPAQLNALTSSYAAKRPMELAESEAWPHLLRIGALRFWVSRLAEVHIGDTRSPGQRKDPDEYRKLLINHRDHPLRWAAP